tara:strand:- start:1153 stop:4395 length:3243 start_codon:yes stop_codon:yes gene_type:complete
MPDTTLLDRRRLNNAFLDSLIDDAPKANPIVGLDSILAKLEETQESDRFNLYPYLPPKSDWGSSLTLSSDQWESYRGALNSVRKDELRLKYMDLRAPELGLQKEYEQYVDDYGQPWGITDAVNPIFDTLISTSTAIPTGLSTGLDSSSVWDGFTAAVNEPLTGWDFVIPGGYKGKKSKRLGWTELGSKYGMYDILDSRVDPLGLYPKNQLDAVKNWAGMLMIDMIVEPLNLVPVAGIATGVGKLAKGLKFIPGAAKLKGVADEFFKIHKDLPDGIRDIIIDLKTRFSAQTQNEAVHALDEIDALMVNIDPLQKRVLGTLMDQPDFMTDQIEALVKGEDLTRLQADELLAKVNVIKTYTKRMFEAEANAPLGGLIDENMFRDVYLHGTEAKDPRLIKAYENATNKRAQYETTTGEGSFLPGLRVPMGAALEKKYKTQLERILDSIEGGRTTELSIDNILKSRSLMHVLHMNSRKFAEAVLTNPEISHKINLPEFFYQGKGKVDGMNWTEWQKNYTEMTGRVIKTVTKRKIVGGKSAEEVIGAWGIPPEVKQYIDYGEELVGNPENFEKFWEAFDNVTNIWKGWATFGTGYHARNTLSMMNSNWAAGMGRAKDGTWHMGDFMLRYLQALKLMTVANGAGRLPKVMKKVADRVAKKYGWDSLDAVPANFKGPDGKPLSYMEIAELGENLGVPQSATKLFNVDSAVSKELWGGAFGELTPLKSSDIPRLVELGADPEALKALTFGEGIQVNPREIIKRTIGTENPALRLNRASSQIIENQGRWALFLDSLAKDIPPEAAAAKSRLWHFDYRMLTEIEKKVFRRIMPFYAWQRFAAPRMAKALIEDPAYMAKMPKTKEAIESLYPEFQESEVPDYWDEILAWQIPFVREDQKGEVKPVSLHFELPILELSKLNSKDLLSSMNALITAPLEAAFNWNLFMDSPVTMVEGQWSPRYEGVEEEGEARRKEDLMFGKFGIGTRKGEFLWSKLFPPVGKALRFQEAEARGEAGAQLMSEFSGVKARFLDIQRVHRGDIYKRNKAQAEFWKILEQRALDDPEFAKIFPELRVYKPKYKMPWLPYMKREKSE